MSEKILRKQYVNHAGIDSRSSDLTRDLRYASAMKNAQYRRSGAPEKRKGFQAHGADFGGCGVFTYSRVNPTTGADDSEVLGVDQNLFRLLATTLTVSYGGASANARLSLFFDPITNQYRCQLEEGTAAVLDFPLGKGFDEASPVTVSQLAVAINAVAGFTAAVTGSSATPAAFLKIVRSWDLSTSGGPVSLEARYSEQVNSTVTNPLATYYARRNGSDFENVSAVNLNNCMFFGSGYDETMKYDGQTFYRAGLPNVASLASVLNGAGAVTGTNYFHRAQYVQWDAAGNLVEGNLKTVSAGLSPAAQRMAVTVANIQAGTGFNTNCAIVAGAQVAVNTITVDDGAGGAHTMKAGDTAYFYDGVSAAYVEREVTAKAAGTITVAGAAVTVADNAVISNNLRISIWRGKTSGLTTGSALQYLVAEVPNNSFAATQVVDDNLADASLGEQLIPPVTDRSPPPKAKYVSQWNGIMILGCNPLDPSILYAADVDGPEYFPNTGQGQYLIETATGDKIAGLAQNNEVFVCMKDDAFAVLSGDIRSGQIRVEVKAQDIGCAAHATIQEIDGVLYWLSKRGPRMSSGGQIPRPVGEAYDEEGKPTGASRIDPEFDNAGRAATLKLQLKRAVGVNDRIGQKYLLFVPAESTSGGNVYANSNSRVFAFDVKRDAWLDWDNLNLAGGATIFGDEFYFQERRFSVFTGNVDSILYRRHNLEDAYDYADNDAAIGGSDDDAWEYSGPWDALSDATLLKVAQEVRLLCLEDQANNEFEVTVRQEINFQKDVTKAEFDLSFAGGGYGEAAFGDAAYGDPSAGKEFHALFRGKCESMRLRWLNNTIHQNVIMTGWEVEWSAPYRKGLKKP